MNRFKALEEGLLRVIETEERCRLEDRLTPRHVAMAKSYFELGFMLINRAVFKPGRVRLPGDPE